MRHLNKAQKKEMTSQNVEEKHENMHVAEVGVKRRREISEEPNLKESFLKESRMEQGLRLLDRRSSSVFPPTSVQPPTSVIAPLALIPQMPSPSLPPQPLLSSNGKELEWEIEDIVSWRSHRSHGRLHHEVSKRWNRKPSQNHPLSTTNTSPDGARAILTKGSSSTFNLNPPCQASDSSCDMLYAGTSRTNEQALVKWSGFSSDSNTWEPLRNIPPFFWPSHLRTFEEQAAPSKKKADLERKEFASHHQSSDVAHDIQISLSGSSSCGPAICVESSSAGILHGEFTRPESSILGRESCLLWPIDTWDHEEGEALATYLADRADEESHLRQCLCRFLQETSGSQEMVDQDMA